MRGPIINFVFHVILDSWTFISKKSKRPSDNEASPKDLEALAKNVLEEIAGQNKSGADGVIAVGLGWNDNEQKVLIIAGGIDKRTVVVNSTCQHNCKANNSAQQGLNGHLRKIITRAIRKEESFASKLGVTSNVNLKSSFIEECPNQESDFRIHTEVQMLDYANGQGGKVKAIVGVPRVRTEADEITEEPQGRLSGGGDCGPWAQDGLEAHNKYRRKHGAPPLQLSKVLCDYAQEWANNLLRKGNLQHRPNNKYGENLYMSWSSGGTQKISASVGVQMWYDEVKHYKYGSDFSSQTGHFTQVVWKSSKELGIAQASGNGRVVVVANYNPPGNFRGRFKENVLKGQN